MVEPGDGQKPPITTNSAAGENPVHGWTEVETDTGERNWVYIPTLEEQEAQRRLNHRMNIVRPILDRFIPDAPEADKPVEYFYEKVARAVNKSVNDLNDDEKDYVIYSHRKRNAEKESLLEAFAKTNIPEDELSEFITIGYQVAKDIALPNQIVNTDVMHNFVSTSESIERAKLYQQLAAKWKERYLVGMDEQEAERRLIDFQSSIMEFSGILISLRPPIRNAEETTSLFDAMIDVFDYAYSLPSISISSFDGKHTRNASPPKIQKLINEARQAGLAQHSAAQIRRVLDIFKNMPVFDDEALQERFLDVVYKYAEKHPLSDPSVQGFLGKLLSAMLANDPQIAVLIKGGNVWGMRAEDFGAADFLVHSYVTKVTPEGINELLLAYRQVPTTNAAKLNQNRIDSSTISGALRELVHDQRPYGYDIMSAMLHFYETGEREQLALALARARAYEGEGAYHPQFDELEQYVFNKEYYEKEVIERVQGHDKKVKAVDVLRRLIENTEPISEMPPVTSDSELNDRLKVLRDSKTGKAAPKDKLKDALDYINARLLEMMESGEVGIEPNHIAALTWLERRAFEVLQNLTYEDQLGAYKEDWSASILRFQELTSSPNDFNENEFQAFLQQVQNAPSMRDAYKLIAGRTLDNINKLARRYRERGIEDSGFLWSGNTAHELIGLTDFKPTSTEQGRKAIKEATRQQVEPSYHPGD